MKRCKSPEVGLCSVPKVPPGIVATCEDHYPGGVCKAKCKDSGSDVIVAVSLSRSRKSKFTLLECKENM